MASAIFADVKNLVEVEHRAFGFGSEAGIRRRLYLVPNTPAPVSRGRSQNRIHRNHGVGPAVSLHHISAGLRKRKQ